jgi:phasin
MQGHIVMTDTTQNTGKAKAKAAPSFETPQFEAPKFEVPKFDWPNVEVPAAYREFAEKGIAQARENYEKFKAATEQATDVLEDTCATASKGASEYGRKLIETSRTNSNAAFDLLGKLLAAKSYSEIVELSTGYWREQFDAVTAQTKDLASHAQKVTTETAAPIKEGFNNAVRKAA